MPGTLPGAGNESAMVLAFAFRELRVRLEKRLLNTQKQFQIATSAMTEKSRVP